MTQSSLKKVTLLSFFLTFFYTINAQTSVKDTVDSINLDEIVINASKDGLKIKEMPIATSVIRQSTLSDNQVDKMSDLSSLAPNLYMPDYGSKLTSPIFIRGIGSRINAPSIGLYVDHVPFFEKSAFQFDFFDLDRVEVLRGPQGTLYGRNSMGGIINIVTLSPDKYQGTKLKVSAGNYGQYTFNAGHYMKLNDKWSTALSGNYVHNDGFHNNEFSNTLVDKINSYGLRHRLKYISSRKFDIENIASFENSNQGGYPYAVYDKQTEETTPINYDQYSLYKRALFSDALHLNYKGNDWKLTNTTSFQYLNDEQGIDQDFSPVNLYYVNQFQDQKTISNELILQSNNTKKYTWLFGVFGFNQSFDNKVDVSFNPVDLKYLKTYDKTVNGAAVFHQSTLKISDHLTAIAGLRYDFENSELHYMYEGVRQGNNLPSKDTIYPNLKEGILLPKFALNYKKDNTSIYASYTTGYKAGGFNTTFEKPEHLTFKNELSNNYELGLKTNVIGNYLTTDFSIFYTDLKNQQIYNTVPSGRGSYLTNAGKSYNQGFEWTLNLRETKGWQGLISYGNTYSKIKEYVKNETTNYNDKFTPYVPMSMFNTQLTKSIPLHSFSWADRVALTVNYNRIGRQFWDLNNELRENPYHLANAKLNFVKNDIQLSIWGKNLFNENYHTFLFEALGNAYAQRNKPRTFGIDVSVEF